VSEKLDWLREEAEQDKEEVRQPQPQRGAKADPWSLDCGLLRARMAEVRAAERGRVAEDVLYASILSRMAEFDVRPTCGVADHDLAWLHSPRAQVSRESDASDFSPITIRTSAGARDRRRQRGFSG
jgi:hypothetical protein